MLLIMDGTRGHLHQGCFEGAGEDACKRIETDPFQGDAICGGPGCTGEQRHRDEGRFGLRADERSEEHTSELQSLMRRSYAVFCLKKKKKSQNTNTQI